MVYMIIWKLKKILMYIKKQIEIKAQNEVQIKILLFDKASTKVSMKYLTYNNIVLAKNIV